MDILRIKKKQGNGFVLTIHCAVCGSPIYVYGTARRKYCDGSTGPDCMGVVKRWQKSKEYKRLKDRNVYERGFVVH